MNATAEQIAADLAQAYNLDKVKDISNLVLDEVGEGEDDDWSLAEAVIECLKGMGYDVR